MPSLIQPTPISRAEHIGSLLRPLTLKEARERYASNQCTAQELKAIEDAAIIQAVKLQKQLGLKTITDGEFRRYDFSYCLHGEKVCRC